MRSQHRQLLQQSDAIVFALAHAQYAAAANGDASLAHGCESSQALVVYTRRDDRAVKFRRRIQVVVVSGEAGIFQLSGLAFVQHAESAADFHSQRRHAPNHFENALELGAFGRLAPGGAHAKTGHAAFGGIARDADDVLRVEQTLTFDWGVVVRALRAVGAV